jgi:hypothetical protein
MNPRSGYCIYLSFIMLSFTQEQNIYYVLRIAAAMCFIGHGAFGIITKPVWCHYFAVFGIGHYIAYQLMPVLGTVDILIGIIMLVYPVRVIALWLVVWGFITAALRPLSGEPFAELIERAGNFGAPLALLFLCGFGHRFNSWFERLKAPAINGRHRTQTLNFFLQCSAFLLLAGHGWLNLAGKKSLIIQYSSLGFNDTHLVALIAGSLEIAMALMALIRPIRLLLLIILAWKMGTELFYPHYEVFEWIERGGSYGILLALWLSLKPANATSAWIYTSSLL